jgi:electron transport complex protein RnfG
MKNMLKLGCTLAFYATAACVGLAFVYNGTKTIIEERQKTDLEAALSELFQGMTGFSDVTAEVKSPSDAVVFQTIYEVKKTDTVLGLAIQATGASYGGPIRVLTGVGVDGKITRVKILEHSDTPGLGANAASPSYYVDKANKITFTGQFSNKSASDTFEVKRDVVAITASTITSRSVSDVVKASAEAAVAYF